MLEDLFYKCIGKVQFRVFFNFKTKIMSNFKYVESLIISNIEVGYTTIEFGHIGSNYQCVINIVDNKPRVIGELLYSIIREGLLNNNSNLLIEFGKKCNEYQKGNLTKIPCLCYYGDNLTIQ